MCKKNYEQTYMMFYTAYFLGVILLVIIAQWKHV